MGYLNFSKYCCTYCSDMMIDNDKNINHTKPHNKDILILKAKEKFEKYYQTYNLKVTKDWHLKIDYIINVMDLTTKE